MTTPAAAAMIAQAILFPVIASIIELFDANAKGDLLYGLLKGVFTNKREGKRVPWSPTQAKVRLNGAPQPLLPGSWVPIQETTALDKNQMIEAIASEGKMG
jgi:hypothetical protein